MSKALLALLTFAMMIGAASVQQRTIYKSRGNVVGRSTADGQGTTTLYDASRQGDHPRIHTGNTTTIYDASGRNVGHYSKR